MSFSDFIKKLGIFLLGFLVVSYLFNWLYSSIVLSRLLTFRSVRQFEEINSDISILIMGDSHAQDGVYPKYIPGSYNLSLTANYVTGYYLLEHYIEEENLDIKLVILTLEMHSFYAVYSGLDRAAFWKQFVDYFEVASKKDNLEDIIEVFNNRLLAEVEYVGGLDEMLAMVKSLARFKEIELGYVIPYKETVYIPLSKLKPPPEIDTNYPKEAYFDQFMMDYFIRFLELCKKHDIDVVLVRFPVTYDHYYRFTFRFDIDEFYNEIFQEISDHDIPYYYLDYHDLYFGRNEIFTNDDHLNLTGAKEFTPILREDLRKLGLLP